MKRLNLKRTLPMLASILLLALIPALIFAQPPGRGPGPRDGRGPGHGPGGGPGGGFLPPPGYLDLSDEQKAAAEALRDQARAELEPIHEQARAQHDQLRTLLDSGNADATAVGRLVIALHTQREQIRTKLEGYEQRFATLLTPEQLTKWENFKELRRSHRPGPGGPDGGPPEDAEGDY